jgi:hypothetical protein
MVQHHQFDAITHRRGAQLSAPGAKKKENPD